MFKLFQNFFLKDTTSKKKMALAKSEVSNWETQIAQADDLWEQGKISEALKIYRLAIEQNPNLVEIKQRLAGRVKQQGDLAVAYERLATGLKNQGKVEQAANYYRQAINLKAITGNTKNQLLRSSVVPVKKTPIPLSSLKEAAFSFQPLTNKGAVVKVASSPPTLANLDRKFDPTPQFLPRIKAVNPRQAKEIDWETAQVYFQKALEHLEKEEWEQSALACKQATQIMPDMAEAYKIWGNALQRMGQTGEAMACYAKAVELKPNLAEVYAGIADIYAQQSKWQPAIKHYQKAIIIKPSAKIYRKLAAVWQKVGETDKVELNLYQATELELSESSSTKKALDSELEAVDRNNIEDSVAAYCRAAEQLGEQDRWKQAAQYYRQALDLSLSRPILAPSAAKENKPQLAQAKSQSAVNQKATSPKAPISQIDKAIKRYHKQAKLQPNSPKIYTDLGRLYSKKGKFAEANACYRKASEISPKYAHAHLHLARNLFKMKQQKEFVKEMQLAFALEPKIGTAQDRFCLANVLVEQNQLQQAIGFYYKAAVVEPTFSAAYHRLSAILSQQGKYDEAIVFLQQSIDHNPQSAESYFLLANQWEKLEKWDNAVKNYSKVLQIDSKYPEATKKLNHALAQKLKSNRKATRESVN